MAFAWGYAPTLAIDAAVRHGIFDALDKTPQTVEQLAANTGASVRGLRAILNLLVSLDLLARQDERYALTRRAQPFWFPQSLVITEWFLIILAINCCHGGSN